MVWGILPYTTITCNYLENKVMKLLRKSIIAHLILPAISLGIASLLPAKEANALIIDSATEDIEQRRFSLGTSPSCNNITKVASPVRNGGVAFKNTINSCGYRAELSMKRTKIGNTYWYGWSMNIPSNWQISTRGYDIVAQWAAYPSNKNFKQACGGVGSKMSIANNNLTLHLQHKGNTLNIQCDKYSLGNVTEMKGKWVDFVMHVKWTGNNDGFMQLYSKIGNGSYQQKVNYVGPTFWNDEDTGPYLKIGNYKGATPFSGPAPRVLYIDEYKLGDINSNFQEVSPGNGSL